MKQSLLLGILIACLSLTTNAAENPDGLAHRFADNQGVKIHYVVKGEGPLIVMIHGFPDFWYTWQHQIETLSQSYTVVAMDTRGYNKSDKPKGQENYSLQILTEDVATVIAHQDQDKAIIVGHDWGGMIAWAFAASKPEQTDKLIILNLPHPKMLARELTHNPVQQKNSAYARQFQLPNSHEFLSAEGLATMIARGDADLKKTYTEAFERSSLESMMYYYRENYPEPPYTDVEFPKITMPVLQFHGLEDTALLSTGLNGTWDEVRKDYTLVTIPGSGHWPHHDAPEMVSQTMLWWLNMRK